MIEENQTACSDGQNEVNQKLRYAGPIASDDFKPRILMLRPNCRSVAYDGRDVEASAVRVLRQRVGSAPDPKRQDVRDGDVVGIAVDPLLGQIEHFRLVPVRHRGLPRRNPPNAPICLPSAKIW